jgi:hypothetical protein
MRSLQEHNNFFSAQKLGDSETFDVTNNMETDLYGGQRIHCLHFQTVPDIQRGYKIIPRNTTRKNLFIKKTMKHKKSPDSYFCSSTNPHKHFFFK